MPSDPKDSLGPLPGLPADLAALDAELAAIRMAERPSFAPELEAELRRAALRRPAAPSRRGKRSAVLAAAVVALLLVGVTVPPARASLVRAGSSLVRMLGSPAEAPPAQPAAAEVRQSPAEAVPQAEPPAPSRAAASPAPSPAPAAVAGASPFRPPVVTLPEIVDARADMRLMRRYYPPRLRGEGVGGTVHLLLWVDSLGSVDHVQISEGSGLAELDRAALAAAPHLRFRPATHSGHPVGTWVEFPLTFEVVEPAPPAQPMPMELPEVSDERPTVPAEWTGEAVVPAPIQVEAEELLRSALGEAPAIEARFGTLDGLLEGEPPPGASPLAWRDQAAEALERAMVRDPDNPAPFLALARIRRKQGLTDEARTLFERGIQRAQRAGERVSPQLVAELAYELGLLLKEEWLRTADGGSVDPAVLGATSCARAGDALRRGPAGVGEALIAWSTLCPEELDAVLRTGFRAPVTDPGLRRPMLASFRAAVEADATHVGANVEILLDLAEKEHWYDLLNGARRFAWATRDHPYALLLGALALQRLGRPEEAAAELRQSLEGLVPEVAARIADPSALMDAGTEAGFTRLAGEDRERAARAFWIPLDPILATDVNERLVEHLVRGAHALLRFGGAGTDAGEVWVRYGPPDRVRVLGQGPGPRIEFWDYGRGPDITFRRSPPARAVALTTEARAYLDDLRTVLPHRYDGRARSVSSLPVEVTRLRTDHGIGLEVRARVPDALATGPTDSLVVGLYQLGPAGERVAVVRERIAAGASELSLGAPAAPGADALVVELYHPRLGQAASWREPISGGESPRPRPFP